MTDILTAVLANLDALVVRWPDFSVVSTPPDWHGNSSFDVQNYPFLDSMLEGAEPEDFAGEELGPWEQADGAFSASFLSLGRDWVLMIRRLGKEYAEQVSLLQTARENSLAHEALLRETRKKEYLLHCIVHDLAGPLTSMKGAFQLMGKSTLSQESMEQLLSIGLRQCARQEDMICEVLEVFAAELKVAEVQETETACLPKVATFVVESMRAAFSHRNVELSYSGPESVCVTGEESKLERVISNLVENGLRHVPEGTAVEVRVSTDTDSVLTEVLDRGDGVPEPIVPTLFQAFSRSGLSGGKIGLGLYFCRITVESWGGEIGYSARPSGGANFWFRLPLRKECS